MTELLHRSRRTGADKQHAFDLLGEALKGCTRCELCRSRTNVVLGEGNINSPLMFVGEGPGREEDESGRPFVGPAGQLLDKILAAVGFNRDNVYIGNIVKCRPPQNRVPAAEETYSCQCWLEAQIALINPKIIVALGNTPLKWFTHTTEGISRVRGRWQTWQGIDFMPMYHPSYLLRNDTRSKNGPKAQTWADIQLVRARYDEITRQGSVM